MDLGDDPTVAPFWAAASAARWPASPAPMTSTFTRRNSSINRASCRSKHSLTISIEPELLAAGTWQDRFEKQWNASLYPEDTIVITPPKYRCQAGAMEFPSNATHHRQQPMPVFDAVVTLLDTGWSFLLSVVKMKSRRWCLLLLLRGRLRSKSMALKICPHCGAIVVPQVSSICTGCGKLIRASRLRRRKQMATRNKRRRRSYKAWGLRSWERGRREPSFWSAFFSGARECQGVVRVSGSVLLGLYTVDFHRVPHHGGREIRRLPGNAVGRRRFSVSLKSFPCWRG